MTVVQRPEPVKKKRKHKDVSGRALPMEKDFEVLKNASRHRSGDRERPAKDAIMSNEQSCLVRDGSLMTIQAQTGSSAEAPKWQLKQKPGRSLPHGEFDLDNPNQQILATNDIYEEYGASKSPNCESYLTMEDSGGNKVMVRSRDPVLSEEQREKCRQWAEEGIEYCNFTGNDMMKLEEEAGRQRIQRLFFDMSSLEKGRDEFFNQTSTSNRSSKEPEFDALSPPPMIEYDSEELERLLCDKEDIKSQ